MLPKIDHIAYLEHPVWLWLRKNQPDFLDAPDESSQITMVEGRKLDRLIEQIFAHCIGYTSVAADVSREVGRC